MNTKLVSAGMAVTVLVAGVLPAAAQAAAIAPPAPRSTAARPAAEEEAPAPRQPTGAPAAAEPAVCTPERVGPAMRDVFPPAANVARADGARTLGQCRPAGGDSVLAAALNLSTDPDTDAAITRALIAYATPVAISTLRGLVVSTRPIAVRALALAPLVWAGVSDDVVMVLANVREFDWLRTKALRALVAGGRPPDARYLTWLRDNSGPKLGQLARELLAGKAAPESEGQTATAGPAPAPAPATAPGAERPRPPLPKNAAAGAGVPSAGAPAAAPAPAAASAPAVSVPARPAAPSARPTAAAPGADANGAMGPPRAPMPPAEPRPPIAPAPPPQPAAAAGPSDGRAVAVASSTVAGAALMLDLSLLGFQDVTPQLLLGSAGAVIGFGTSWALSRFGVRPTVEQASWFANATAWGTLAGITIYGGSGATDYKLRYGSLVLGEMAGMGVGVWSARRWTWTGPQIVLTDSLFLGTAMVGFGVNRLRYETPRVTAAVAIGVLPAMLGSAIAGHLLAPSGNDLALMTTSALAGAWLGGLASGGIAESELLPSRWGQGGLLIGAGLGYLGGAVAGGFTEVQPLRLQVGAGGIVAGNLMGLGLHLVTTGLRRRDEGELTTADGNRLKLGASIGGLVVGAAAFAAAPHLKLGPASAPMTMWGGVYGAGTMWLASAASYHGQERNEATDAVLYGSMLATGVAGAATGLVLSGHFNPDAADQWTTFGATAAAISAAWGTTALIGDKPSMADGAGVLGGAAVGLAGGALFTHSHTLRAPSVGAGFVGTGFGAIAGLLAPTLSQSEWTSGRRTGGGTGLGAGAGAIVGTVIGQLSDASAREVAVAGIGTALGLTAGLGAGRMWPGEDTQAERIGILAGMTTLGAASVALMRPLRLREAMPDNSGELIATGTVLGMANGLWTAALLDPSGDPGKVAADRLQGGLLFGGSLGFATAAGLAPRLRYQGGLTLLWGTTIAGTAVGRGLALLIADQPGRGDAAATLVGSLAGTAGGILALRLIEPDTVDLTAATLGLAYGASMGALAPSLGDRTFTDWKRRNTGGLLVGVGAGSVAGLTLRRAFHGDERSVGLTAAAGLDGAATGIGWGLLLGGDPSGENASSQALRIGVVAGATAGIGLGMASWSRLTLGSGDAMMIGAATVLAGANATMIPTLGHATTAEWNQRRMGGGFLAGAGTASFAATLLAPVVEVDGDLVGNALAMDGLFTGAGAGVGALASGRADAPVAGMLIGGTAGLVLGGALHRRIELDSGDAPILVAGGIEGLWMGAWMPYVLREPAAITDGQRGGGIAAGVFGGLGLSVLVNTAFSPNAGDTEFAMLSSGIGAGIGGGIALLSSTLNDRPAVGLMLGGTGGGLLVGGLLAPRLRIDERVAGSAAVGGLLGATEALLFTWSSRADGRDAYQGAALLGASVGTGLGLANGIAIGADSNGRLPALAGFTAWGAWMGSLSGSLVARDAHEITAGGVIGSNAGLLAGYGLLRSGAIETSDFGWLSLFGAMGTALGAGVGAPFASRGEPTPILAGMALGPAVGMGVGAFVLPRLRAASGSGSPTVALRSAFTHAFKLRSTSLGSAVSSGRPELSSTVARDLDARRRVRRNLFRALDATIKIADCAPMLGALPTPDANGANTNAGGNANGSSTPPMLVGLVGHWH